MNTHTVNINSGISELQESINSVTRDFVSNNLIHEFEKLIHYGIYEKILLGEKFPEEMINDVYNTFVEDEEYEKCEILKKHIK